MSSEYLLGKRHGRQWGESASGNARRRLDLAVRKSVSVGGDVGTPGDFARACNNDCNSGSAVGIWAALLGERNRIGKKAAEFWEPILGPNWDQVANDSEYAAGFVEGVIDMTTKYGLQDVHPEDMRRHIKTLGLRHMDKPPSLKEIYVAWLRLHHAGQWLVHTQGGHSTIDLFMLVAGGRLREELLFRFFDRRERSWLSAWAKLDLDEQDRMLSDELFPVVQEDMTVRDKSFLEWSPLELGQLIRNGKLATVDEQMEVILARKRKAEVDRLLEQERRVKREANYQRRLELRNQEKAKYYLKSQLIGSRGWTERLVTDLLGDPDKSGGGANRHGGNYKRYEKTRVLEAERHPTFRSFVAKRRTDDIEAGRQLILASSGATIPTFRSEVVISLAKGIVAEWAFDRLPILADALEEAGCDEEWLASLRTNGFTVGKSLGFVQMLADRQPNESPAGN